MHCLKIAAILVLTATAALSSTQSSKLTADQNSVLEDARAYALKYVKRLPDFICTQTTSQDVSIRNISFGGVVHDSRDTVDEQLTYVGGNEKYTVLTIDGKKASNVAHVQLKGAISWGEFGTQVSQVFDPASHTVFRWDREQLVDSRHAWAFKYRVPRESGAAVIDRPTQSSLVVSFSGRIVIDPESKDILEITSALDIPATFPIHNVTRRVIYADQDIRGKKYCLPAHSEMHTEEGRKVYDNQIDFKDYHHFSSESTIHFDSDNP